MTSVVILAGTQYRTILAGKLAERQPRVQVVVPMAGMGLGRQLHFLDSTRAAGRAPGGGHPACRCPDGDGALHLAGCPGANDA